MSTSSVFNMAPLGIHAPGAASSGINYGSVIRALLPAAFRLVNIPDDSEEEKNIKVQEGCCGVKEGVQCGHGLGKGKKKVKAAFCKNCQVNQQKEEVQQRAHVLDGEAGGLVEKAFYTIQSARVKLSGDRDSVRSRLLGCAVRLVIELQRRALDKDRPPYKTTPACPIELTSARLMLELEAVLGALELLLLGRTCEAVVNSLHASVTPAEHAVPASSTYQPYVSSCCLESISTCQYR